MDASKMPPRHRESLELLCLVIRSEKNFHLWYQGLVACPANLRINALLQMITEMRRNQEDDALIDAVAALCDNELFETVRLAVSEFEALKD